MAKNDRYNIPLCQQYALTLDEAAVYFNIGRNTLRKIIKEHADAPFILRVGRRILIKRALCEEFLNGCSSL